MGSMALTQVNAMFSLYGQATKSMQLLISCNKCCLLLHTDDNIMAILSTEAILGRSIFKHSIICQILASCINKINTQVVKLKKEVPVCDINRSKREIE